MPRLPTTMSSALRVASIDRTYRVVVALTAMGPTFWVVSVTRKLPPGVAATGGSLTTVTAMSAVGRLTCIVLVAAVQLFVSLVSFTAARSSAQPNRTYVPAGVPVGIVTVAVTVEKAFGASGGMARAPLSRT